MKKDVIYIDVEDDITAIIGKVKAAAASIVALVPPKRAGVLQSAVNLKLLQKSAQANSKRIVLITSDPSLLSLAGGVRMPVAKNLQSKPEIPQPEMLQAEGNDVINGNELPVGELAGTPGPDSSTPSAADEIARKVTLVNQPEPPTSGKKHKETSPGDTGGKLAGKIKIPDFNRFRTRLFLIGGGAAALIAFLIWALIIAPTATITITAKTSAVAIDKTLRLDPAIAASNLDELKIKPIVKQVKKSVAVDFEATGSKETGKKASGTITIRNCDYGDGFTLSAGTIFKTSGGMEFVSTASVSVPKFTGPASGCNLAGNNSGKATVAAEGKQIGTEYNIAAQSYTISGVSGQVDAIGSEMTGGSKETVTVVSQSDIDKAKDKLPKADHEAVKKELTQNFTDEQQAIEASFTATAADPSVTPALNEQAKQAKLTVETTYTILGLAKSDVKHILEGVLKKALENKTNQSVVNDGSDKIVFQSFQQLSDGTFSVRLVATGYIGTTVDTKQLAMQIQGKRYAEIQDIISKIPGVEKVDIKLSPFWVASAPNNPGKITISFSVVNDSQ